MRLRRLEWKEGREAKEGQTGEATKLILYVSRVLLLKCDMDETSLSYYFAIDNVL